MKKALCRRLFFQTKLRDKTNANARSISTISMIFKGTHNFEELINQSRVIADKSMLIKNTTGCEGWFPHYKPNVLTIQ